MKKKIQAVLLSAFMLLQGAGAFAAESVSDSVLDKTVNVFENGGFEDGEDGWNVSGYYSLSNVARSGSKSFAFIRTQSSPTFVTAKKVLKVEKNTDYTVSYYVKQVSGAHIFSVYGGTLSNKMLEKFNQTASNDWVKMSYSINSGDNDRIIVEVKDYSYVDAEIYYDDFMVECASEQPTAEINTLINGGFEWGEQGWSRNGEFYFNNWGGVRSGEKALYIHKNTYWHNYLVQEIQTEKNKKYELSYWYINPNGEENKAGHNLRIYMGENTMAYFDSDDSGEWYTSTAKVNWSMPAKTNWTKVTVTFETGDNEKIYIRFMPGAFSNEQPTAIDDINLKIVDRESTKETVMNGDFEGGKRASNQNAPIYWTGWFALSQNEAHSGTSSMRLGIDRPIYDNMYNKVEVEPNTDYTLEWYEKRTAGAYVFKLQNTTVSSTGIFYQGTGSGEWVKRSVDFNSLDNSSVNVEFMKLLAQGTEDDETKAVYFDDVKLIRKSASVKNVVIEGYPSKGKTLYANAKTSDENNTLIGVKYQWQSSADGKEWKNVEGAVKNEFVVTDDTQVYRVGASASFNVLYNNATLSSQSEAVYSDVVSKDDKTSFENDICSDIVTAISIKPDGIAVNKDYYSDLAKKVFIAREYGINLEENVENYSEYSAIEGQLAEVKSSEVSYENKDITINVMFTAAANADDITKKNIVLSCGGQDVDYKVEAIKENDRIIGAKVTLKNEIEAKGSYRLKIKFGAYCDFDEIYRVPKPLTIENVLLKNSNNEIVDRVAEVVDGKLKITADVKNNTYSSGKKVKLITAVYDGERLYAAKINDAEIAYNGTFNLDATMDIPKEGLTEKWNTSVFVWDDDAITPLYEKQTKTFGIDAVNDESKDITVAFIGGSITQGNNYTKPFIENWQKDRTGKITSINAGVGGTTSQYGTMRLYEDVLSKKPDIVFVEFTLNDYWLNEEQTKKNVESMIRQCCDSEHQPVISFIHIPNRVKAADGESYQIDEKIGYYNEVLEYYGLEPFNVHQSVVDLVNKGEYSWDDFVSEGNVHPNETQGANIATVMYNEFKTNNAKYVKNVKQNPTKGFGADTYGNPTVLSSKWAAYDSKWQNNTVEGVVTEGYGVPTSLPFECFMASSTTGANMTFKFSGTKLIVSSLVGQLGKTASYTITDADGNLEKSGTLSTYISGYNWYENIILSLDGLKDTEHTLSVTVNSGNGLFGIGEFWIDE